MNKNRFSEWLVEVLPWPGLGLTQRMESLLVSSTDGWHPGQGRAARGWRLGPGSGCLAQKDEKPRLPNERVFR